MGYKSSMKEKDSSNRSRMHISQSAPHTPVSTPHENEGMTFKSVPRLLSEPLVNSNSHSPSQRSVDSGVRKSPFLNDKKSEISQSTLNGDSCQDSLTVKNNYANIVPVHSQFLTPKDCIPKSPIVKRDTKIQLENNKMVHAKMSSNTDLDVTPV